MSGIEFFPKSTSPFYVLNILFSSRIEDEREPIQEKMLEDRIITTDFQDSKGQVWEMEGDFSILVSPTSDPLHSQRSCILKPIDVSKTNVIQIEISEYEDYRVKVRLQLTPSNAQAPSSHSLHENTLTEGIPEFLKTFQDLNIITDDLAAFIRVIIDTEVRSHL